MALCAARDADIIDGFEMEPIDLSSDSITFRVQHKSQLEKF